MPKNKPPKIEFDEKTHKYVVDGEVKPSVTQIVGLIDKPGLDKWRVTTAVEHVINAIPEIVKNPELSEPVELSKLQADAWGAPDAVANKAAEFGNVVHALIVKYLTTNRKPQCPDEKTDAAIKAFGIWKKRHKIEVFALEEPFYNPQFGYCGRPDFRGTIDGRFSVVDWKTGRFVKQPFGMQLAAYAANFVGIEVVGVLNIREGLPYWKDLTADRERYWNQFLALLDYWKIGHGEIGK